MEIYDLFISLSTIIILSYVFDLFASRTKLPSVVLLLLLGMGIKFTLQLLGFDFGVYQTRIQILLPVLGTLGLIFIVLEGSLELEINSSKKAILLRSFASAMVLLFGSTAAIWALLYYGFHQDHYKALLNAVPLSVISSAIAIPSAAALRGYEKEFVIYESSFSDILGVMAFNFVLTNAVINLDSFLHLGYELLMIILVSIIATIVLGFLFERLQQHKKFVLMLAIMLLFYGVAKYFHLSALVLIFIFGLFAGNNEWFITKLFRQKFKMEVLQHEIHNFQAFIVEFAFVIRTFFFVIFGASLDLGGLFNTQKLLVALIIIASIYTLRFVYFKATRDDKDNMLWFVAPRGLITILLFYSIPDEYKLGVLDQDVLLMVILASVFILAIGSMYKGNKGNGAVAADDVLDH